MQNNTIHHLIQMALNEDIGTGDITTENLIEPDAEGKGKILAKESLVIAGLDVAKQVFEYLDAEIRFHPRYADGNRLKPGDIAAEIQGRLRTLLMGERTALNFLQRLSGIATHTRSYADMLKAFPNIRLADTRKTTPGWRVLEKYAVRVGGAYNHRMGLFDGVLIKDNHVAACGGIKKAIVHIRNKVSHLVKTEVEVSDLSEVKEALSAGADVIMLDNMDIAQIKEAVAVINGRALVEVSGGITKDSLALLADTGVDIISVGALTHGARSVDLSLDISC